MMETSNDIVMNVYTLIGIIIAVFGAGVSGGVLIIGTIARSILQDEKGVKAVEGLANSVPKDVANSILAVARAGAPVIELLEEAFDGVPASDKEDIIEPDVQPRPE